MNFYRHNIYFLFIFLFLYAWSVSSAAHSSSDESMQKAILYYVNDYRAKHHLRPLTINPIISVEAEKHSRDMANHTTSFGHSGFYGRIHRLYKSIGQCKSGAENVAYYREDAKRLVDGWIASPGHRRNIMGNYNMTGIGIVHSKKGWAYYTQIFLRHEKEAAKNIQVARRSRPHIYFTF